MKKITSAVLGLSLSLAVAGLGFAQTAAPAAAKDAPMAAAPAKKHVKKVKKAKVTAEKPAAATPAAK